MPQLEDVRREIMRLGGGAATNLSGKIRRLTGGRVAPAALAVLVELEGTPRRLSWLADSIGFAQPAVSVHVQKLDRKDRRSWRGDGGRRERRIARSLRKPGSLAASA